MYPEHVLRQQRDIEDKIISALKGIRYGSVEIIVHDSKVVQIERKEKMRFEQLGHNGAS